MTQSGFCDASVVVRSRFLVFLQRSGDIPPRAAAFCSPGVPVGPQNQRVCEWSLHINDPQIIFKMSSLVTVGYYRLILVSAYMGVDPMSRVRTLHSYPLQTNNLYFHYQSIIRSSSSSHVLRLWAVPCSCHRSADSRRNTTLVLGVSQV